MVTIHTKEEYDACVEYISNIPRFAEGRNKSGNENLSAVLDILGNPHRKIRCVHVAGTNGKGSTVHMIKNLLTEEGFTVGTFISPHLVSINERIAVSGQNAEGFFDENISDENFVTSFETVKKAVDVHEAQGGIALSYFEYLFAIAAVYFAQIAETTPDYVVWETGLGGRLDATNLVQPEACVITAIGLDHVKYLGDTVEQIAAEKAGIIKPGVPVVYLTGSREADMVISERAEDLESPAYNVAQFEHGINFAEEKNIDFSFACRYYSYDHLSLTKQCAPYQADNAACAIFTANLLCGGEQGMNIEHVQSALSRFSFPGRMEEAGPHVVLDGAHNFNAVKRFVEAVKSGYAGRRWRLLFAVACDKDYEEMINFMAKELSPEYVYVTSLDSDRALSADYAAALFAAHGLQVYTGEKIEDCFKKAYGDAIRNDDVLFCVGSLYLIGSIKELMKYDKL